MASTITFGGLASGIDTNSIISQLVSLEGRKVTALQSRQNDFQKKIDAFDTLQGRLSNLQDTLGGLSDAKSFVAAKASLSGNADGILTATTRSDAKVGTYKVTVSKLAESTFIRSDGFADPDTDLAVTGTLSLQVGTTQTDITIDGTNATLHGIRDAINASGADVVATTVFDGTSWFLELRGKETGAANAVTVLAEPSLPPPQGSLLNLAQKRAATDAAFTIDGQSYTSASNSIEDAIQGVTLQLTAAQANGAGSIQLTIGDDYDAVQSKLQELVSDFNSVIDFLNTQSAPRADSTDSVKPLAGEAALQSLRNALSGAISRQLPGVTGYSSLASIGIKSDKSGRLALDSTKLKDALATDLDAVKAVLTDATNGAGVRLKAVVKQRTDSIDGSIHLRQEAFRSSMDALDRQVTRAQDSLTTYEANLRRQYAAMETVVGKLQQQGNSLASLSTNSSSK